MNRHGRRRERAKRAVAEGDASPSGAIRSSTSPPEAPLLVLASGSPRRARLLAEAGLAFEVLAVDADETPPALPPPDVALALARRKADLAFARVRAAEGWILAADTVVALDGRILDKPATPEAARATLRALSGRAHEVWTAVVVLRLADGDAFVAVERAQVEFRALAPEEIDAYVATGEPFDKAGGYGVQGEAAKFVTRLDGDVTTVVGLPVKAVCDLLVESGHGGCPDPFRRG